MSQCWDPVPFWSYLLRGQRGWDTCCPASSGCQTSPPSSFHSVPQSCPVTAWFPCLPPRDVDRFPTQIGSLSVPRLDTKANVSQSVMQRFAQDTGCLFKLVLPYNSQVCQKGTIFPGFFWTPSLTKKHKELLGEHQLKKTPCTTRLVCRFPRKFLLA